MQAATEQAIEAWLSGGNGAGHQSDIGGEHKSDDIAQKSTATDVDPVQLPTVQSKLLQVSIPAEDVPWVRKLLAVRHSKKPGLPAAIENNINEFVWADLAYDELQRHKSPLVSAPRAGAGERGGPPKELAPTNGIGEYPRRSSGRPRRAKPRLDAIEEADRGSEEGKKDAPGKAG